MEQKIGTIYSLENLESLIYMVCEDNETKMEGIRQDLTSVSQRPVNDCRYSTRFRLQRACTNLAERWKSQLAGFSQCGESTVFSNWNVGDWATEFPRATHFSAVARLM
jgi:hypothetical protein